MELWEVIAISVGLAMDAFAVALCKGACLAEMEDRGESYYIGISFGLFQALMPLIGWFLGISFKSYIQSVDHFVAFVLLGFIGIKLIVEAIKAQGEALVCTPLKLWELFMLSVATSIDALAAGIAFAVLDINIWLAIGLIGIITFSLSFVAVKIGRRFGARFHTKAQMLGGSALILIGAKILYEHLSKGV